jgi:hypothetical protein
MIRPLRFRGLALPVAALILGVAAVLAVFASSALGRAAASPSPSPTDRPTPPPSGQPSPRPSEPPAGGPIEVDLDIATDDHVSVVIDDQTGRLVEARSGRAGDGMSVRWSVLKVENLDDRTLRLNWVGFPDDARIKLGLSTVDGKLRLRMVQAVPPPNSDGLGFDRVLVLAFDTPISAEDTLPSIQGSLDTED